MSAVSVTLKIATSLDGRIALEDGTSQWITGSDARARSHQLRAAHDGVLVGVGTVLADDPLLTARSVPLPPSQPVRIVMDSAGHTPRAPRSGTAASRTARPSRAGCLSAARWKACPASWWRAAARWRPPS